MPATPATPPPGFTPPARKVRDKKAREQAEHMLDAAQHAVTFVRFQHSAAVVVLGLRHFAQTAMRRAVQRLHSYASTVGDVEDALLQHADLPNDVPMLRRLASEVADVKRMLATVVGTFTALSAPALSAAASAASTSSSSSSSKSRLSPRRPTALSTSSISSSSAGLPAAARAAQATTVKMMNAKLSTVQVQINSLHDRLLAAPARQARDTAAMDALRANSRLLEAQSAEARAEAAAIRGQLQNVLAEVTGGSSSSSGRGGSSAAQVSAAGQAAEEEDQAGAAASASSSLASSYSGTPRRAAAGSAGSAAGGGGGGGGVSSGSGAGGGQERRLKMALRRRFLADLCGKLFACAGRHAVVAAGLAVRQWSSFRQSERGMVSDLAAEEEEHAQTARALHSAKRQVLELMDARIADQQMRKRLQEQLSWEKGQREEAAAASAEAEAAVAAEEEEFKAEVRHRAVLFNDDERAAFKEEMEEQLWREAQVEAQEVQRDRWDRMQAAIRCLSLQPRWFGGAVLAVRDGHGGGLSSGGGHGVGASSWAHSLGPWLAKWVEVAAALAAAESGHRLGLAQATVAAQTSTAAAVLGWGVGSPAGASGRPQLSPHHAGGGGDAEGAVTPPPWRVNNSAASPGTPTGDGLFSSLFGTTGAEGDSRPVSSAAASPPYTGTVQSPSRSVPTKEYGDTAGRDGAKYHSNYDCSHQTTQTEYIGSPPYSAEDEADADAKADADAQAFDAVYRVELFHCMSVMAAAGARFAEGRLRTVLALLAVPPPTPFMVHSALSTGAGTCSKVSAELLPLGSLRHGGGGVQYYRSSEKAAAVPAGIIFNRWHQQTRHCLELAVGRLFTTAAVDATARAAEYVTLARWAVYVVVGQLRAGRLAACRTGLHSLSVFAQSGSAIAMYGDALHASCCALLFSLARATQHAGLAVVWSHWRFVGAFIEGSNARVSAQTVPAAQSEKASRDLSLRQASVQKKVYDTRTSTRGLADRLGRAFLQPSAQAEGADDD